MAIRKTTLFISQTPMVKYWREPSISPNCIATASNKKYKWECQECGEIHEQGVASLFRSGYSLCKKCAYKKRANNTKKKQLQKRKSVADIPKLSATWDSTHNNGIHPEEILAGSPKEYYWICTDCGKSFLRAVCEQKRNKNTYCLECSFKHRKKRPEKIFIPKETAIIKHPEIYKLWSNDNAADPRKITIYSRLNFKFICVDCGKPYIRSPKMVTSGQKRCKECARKVAAEKMVEKKRENMISIMENPILSKLWDSQHNHGVDPNMVSQYSKEEYNWKCPECNRVWSATPSKKIYACCDECSKTKGGITRIKQIIDKEGSFGSLYPQWAEEWDYKLNNGVTPFDVTPRSNTAYHFICRCGHHYTCSPYDRVQRQAGCSKCNKSSHTSFVEQLISFYLEKIEYTIPNYKTESGLELDAFMPNKSYAVEYDGPWHSKESTQVRDRRKDEYCKLKNINLLRISESNDRPDSINGSIIYFNRKARNYQWLLDTICEYFGMPKVITDILNDGPQILFRVSSVPIKTSFEAKKPNLLPYWDKKKNYPLKPDMIGYTSEQILHWHCPICGLHFTESPRYISLTKYHCPKCAKNNQRLNISKSKKKEK